MSGQHVDNSGAEINELLGSPGGYAVPVLVLHKMDGHHLQLPFLTVALCGRVPGGQFQRYNCNFPEGRALSCSFGKVQACTA